MNEIVPSTRTLPAVTLSMTWSRLMLRPAARFAVAFEASKVSNAPPNIPEKETVLAYEAPGGQGGGEGTGGENTGNQERDNSHHGAARCKAKDRRDHSMVPP